jgi:hypothetical protein
MLMSVLMSVLVLVVLTNFNSSTDSGVRMNSSPVMIRFRRDVVPFRATTESGCLFSVGVLMERLVI